MGLVFDIFRTSLNDGPGIRTCVFLKGCPLRCRWCHNPESYKGMPQLFFIKEKCTLCGRCVTYCANGCHTVDINGHKVGFDKCIACGSCVNECLSDALSIKGREMTAKEIIDIAVKDKSYYDATGGGITISGGEPLLQWKFTLEILKLAKQSGINTCIETSGYCKEEHFGEVLKYCDLLLYDCKGINENKHITNTGVSNKQIISNLGIVTDTPVYLRCPLIPGVNDSEEDLILLANYADSHSCIKQVEIMPYHDMGNHKQMRFGNEKMLLDLESAGNEDKQRWEDILSKFLRKKLVIN